MSGAAGSPDPPPSPPSTLSSDSPAAHEFRWQALFQRTREPVFVLNRRRRFLFVNRAWEILTGLSAAEARGLACVRRPPIPQDPWDVVIRAVCCPPQEVLKGRPGRSRRLVPGKVARWWDVEFFPLHADEGLLCIVGKVSVVPGGDPAGSAPLPERIVAYREGRKQHYTFARGQVKNGSHAPFTTKVQQALALLPRSIVLVCRPRRCRRYSLANRICSRICALGPCVLKRHSVCRVSCKCACWKRCPAVKPPTGRA